MTNPYYTVEQISEMLDIHPKTIQRYIREGKLRATKIGKSWRVTGHDLSIFTEGESSSIKNHSGDTAAYAPVTASAVADIDTGTRDNAIRIMNTLTAVSNSKPPEYGPSSLHTQFIEGESKLRVTLWGGARFIGAIMDAIAALTENEME